MACSSILNKIFLTNVFDSKEKNPTLEINSKFCLVNYAQLAECSEMK